MPIGTSGLDIGLTDESFFLIQSAELTSKADRTDAKNGAGAVVGAAWHGKMSELTVDALFLSDTSNPHAEVGTGTPVTYTDTELTGNWYVDESTKKWSNTEFKSQTLKHSGFPNLGA